MVAVDGIEIFNNSNHVVFLIKNFSDEFKQIIRDELASICHGISDGASKRVSYSYKATLAELLTRYKDKPKNTKLGMLGELISHVLFIKYFENYDTVSPFFNSEERSIKKAFDLILFNTFDKELWISEVKSGKKHLNKGSNDTTLDLLSTAKYDLKKRLNENNSALWKNAIIGAKTSLENFSDKKDAVKNILENIQDSATTKTATSLDKNVILVSNLFNDISDEINTETTKNFANSLKTEALFKNEIIVAIQKNTCKKIEDFLFEEDSKDV